VAVVVVVIAVTITAVLALVAVVGDSNGSGFERCLWMVMVAVAKITKKLVG
jgi:hypothetical protein